MMVQTHKATQPHGTSTSSWPMGIFACGLGTVVGLESEYSQKLSTQARANDPRTRVAST